MKSQADGNTYPIAYPPLKVPKEMVAVALWASVSDKVDRELAGGRAKLKPAEWKSGDNLWLMEIIAPSLSANPQAMKKLLEELASSAFSRCTFKARRINAKSGKLEAIVMQVRKKADLDKAVLAHAD